MLSRHNVTARLFIVKFVADIRAYLKDEGLDATGLFRLMADIPTAHVRNMLEHF